MYNNESYTKKQTTNSSNSDIFFDAISNGDIVRVRKYLTIGVSPDTKSSDGLPALHRAVLENNLEIAYMLLNHGAKVDAGSSGGLTALMVASYFNSDEMVAWLLLFGANQFLYSDNGYCALDIAAEKGNLLSIGILIEALPRDNPSQTVKILRKALFIAEKNKHVKTFKLLAAALMAFADTVKCHIVTERNTPCY
jgi:ankyrin repeat protein